MARTKKRVPPVIMKILKAVENMSAAEASEALQNAAEDEESVENRVLLLQARVKLLQDAMKPKRPPRKRKRKPKPPKVEEVVETPPEPEPEEPAGTVTAIDLDNLGALFGAVERGANDAPAPEPPAPKKPAEPEPADAVDFGELDALMSSDDDGADAAETPAAAGKIDFGGLDDLMAGDDAAPAPAAQKGGDEIDLSALSGLDDAPDATAKPGGAIEMPDLSALGDLDDDGAAEDDVDDDGADLSALMASMNGASPSGASPKKDDAAADLSALQNMSDASSDDGDEDDLSALMGAFSGDASDAADATVPDTSAAKTPAETGSVTKAPLSPAIPNLSALKDLNGSAEEETDDDLTALMGAMGATGDDGAADISQQGQTDAAAATPIETPDAAEATGPENDPAADLSAFDTPEQLDSVEDSETDDLSALMGAFNDPAPEEAEDAAPGVLDLEALSTPEGDTFDLSDTIPETAAEIGDTSSETADLSALMGALEDPAPDSGEAPATPDLSALDALATQDEHTAPDTVSEAAGEADDAPAEIDTTAETADLSALMAEMDGEATEESANPDLAQAHAEAITPPSPSTEDSAEDPEADTLTGLLSALSDDEDDAPEVQSDDETDAAATGPEAQDLSDMMQALSEPDQPDAPDEQDITAVPLQTEEDQAELPPEPVSSGDQPVDPGTPDYSEFEALMGSAAQHEDPDGAETGTDPVPDMATPPADPAQADLAQLPEEETGTVSETPDAEADADFKEFNALMAAAQTDIPAEEADGVESPASADPSPRQEADAAADTVSDDGQDNDAPMGAQADSTENDADETPIADLSELDALEDIQEDTAEATGPTDPQPDAEPASEQQETPGPDLSELQAPDDTPDADDVSGKSGPEALHDAPAASAPETAETDPAATGETKAAQPEPVQPEAPAPRLASPAASFAEGKKKATLDDIYSLFPKGDG